MGIFISPEQKQKNLLLEGRCRIFALQIMRFAKNHAQDICNNVIFNQVIRSGASIGANYIEANEATSGKEFLYRIELSKKEAKETIYWLEIYRDLNGETAQAGALVNEADQLFKIFCKILHNTKTRA